MFSDEFIISSSVLISTVFSTGHPFFRMLPAGVAACISPVKQIRRECSWQQQVRVRPLRSCGKRSDDCLSFSNAYACRSLAWGCCKCFFAFATALFNIAIQFCQKQANVSNGIDKRAIRRYNKLLQKYKNYEESGTINCY